MPLKSLSNLHNICNLKIFAAFSHAAFPEIGTHHNFHGMPPFICEEMKSFPFLIRADSIFKERKRRLDSDDEQQDGDDETDVNTDYPLMKRLLVGQRA